MTENKAVSSKYLIYFKHQRISKNIFIEVLLVFLCVRNMSKKYYALENKIIRLLKIKSIEI